MLGYIWSFVCSFIHLLIKILLVSLVHSSIILGASSGIWLWLVAMTKSCSFKGNSLELKS